jgi:hypothetical protein
MLKKEDVILYDLFKKKVADFINNKAQDGAIKNKDFTFYISRFHINEQIVKQLIKTLKDHGCIEMEKHRIVIKNLNVWLSKGSSKIQKAKGLNSSLNK